MGLVGVGSPWLYSPDFDSDYPQEALALKEAISGSDAVLFVSPEYNRSIPGALKNAIDWASRPWGQNCIFAPDGEVLDDTTSDVLRGNMAEIREHIVRVLTVLPRE